MKPPESRAGARTALSETAAVRGARTGRAASSTSRWRFSTVAASPNAWKSSCRTERLGSTSNSCCRNAMRGSPWRTTEPLVGSSWPAINRI